MKTFSNTLMLYICPIIALLLILSTSVFGASYYLTSTGNGDKSGASWENAGYILEINLLEISPQHSSGLINVSEFANTLSNAQKTAFEQSIKKSAKRYIVGDTLQFILNNGPKQLDFSIQLISAEINFSEIVSNGALIESLTLNVLKSYDLDGDGIEDLILRVNENGDESSLISIFTTTYVRVNTTNISIATTNTTTINASASQTNMTLLDYNVSALNNSTLNTSNTSLANTSNSFADYVQTNISSDDQIPLIEIQDNQSIISAELPFNTTNTLEPQVVFPSSDSPLSDMPKSKSLNIPLIISFFISIALLGAVTLFVKARHASKKIPAQTAAIKVVSTISPTQQLEDSQVLTLPPEIDAGAGFDGMSITSLTNSSNQKSISNNLSTPISTLHISLHATSQTNPISTSYPVNPDSLIHHETAAPKNPIGVTYPKYSSRLEYQLESEVHKLPIAGYLEQHIAAGYSPPQLVADCVAKGWDKTFIESIVAHACMRRNK